MKVEMIGTGAMKSKELSACTLVNEEILVDMPNGSIKRLKQTEHNILKIKAVLITHLHGDHFLDIPFYMKERVDYMAEDIAKIYCPFGTKKKIEKIFEIAFPGDYEIVEKKSNVEFIEFEQLDNEKILEDVYVTSKLVDHGDLVPAYGYIIEKNNKKIGFSGDSKRCQAIDDIIKQSDISILDMSVEEYGIKSHMGIMDIEEICNEYIDKTIVATHMRDLVKEKARSINIKNLIVPDDGQKIEI